MHGRDAADSLGAEANRCPFRLAATRLSAGRFVCNAGEKTVLVAALSVTQRIRIGRFERGCRRLLTARFRVRIPGPEPNLKLDSGQAGGSSG